MIEVELRGFLEYAKYRDLLNFFEGHAADIEEDDKIATYFNYTEGILKVVDETSKNLYKLSLKQGDEYTGLGMSEIEVYMTTKQDYDISISVLRDIGFSVKSVIPQKRVNATYKNVFFSIKHTPSWGYHFEAEMLVKNEGSVQKANSHIRAVCDELRLKPLSAGALQDFINTLESK